MGDTACNKCNADTIVFVFHRFFKINDCTYTLAYILSRNIILFICCLNTKFCLMFGILWTQWNAYVELNKVSLRTPKKSEFDNMLMAKKAYDHFFRFWRENEVTGIVSDRSKPSVPGYWTRLLAKKELFAGWCYIRCQKKKKKEISQVCWGLVNVLATMQLTCNVMTHDVKVSAQSSECALK